MPKAIVDGVEVEFDAGLSVLQVAEIAGAEVPRFCYHERLSVAGNCRMCLVQIEDARGMAPKPVASCAFPASDGLKIHTRTDTVKKAREGVMEFLLINHPLDCPICDQGGECDLQDQAMAFGAGNSRFEENKRAVEPKYMGPLIKTIMTRCIQCTRCVRFATEVAGVEELGLLNRGEHAEISSIEQSISSELSGNLVDICPVGALTSKPYAFNARPWELRKTESIDVMDAVGSNIRVDARGKAVLRVLPRTNEAINEEWISDKTRHAIDGLSKQRLDRPYVRDNGKLRPASWDEALGRVADKVKSTQPEKMAAIMGDQCAAEEMYALKTLMDAVGVASVDCRQDGATGSTANRAHYTMAAGIAAIEHADAILLVGANPRIDAPIIGARIRKRFLEGGLKVAGIGAAYDQTYAVDWLGEDYGILDQLVKSSDGFAKVLKDAKNPLILVGGAALRNGAGEAVVSQAAALAQAVGGLRDDWHGFGVLQLAASRVGGLDLGCVPQDGGLSTSEILEKSAAGDMDLVYLLAADELDADALKDTFVVYQGHHGDAGASVADVILPGAAYTEKSGTYVNTEGRVQQGKLVVFPPGEAREDWKILRALSAMVGKVLPFDDLVALRGAMVQSAPSFALLDTLADVSWSAPDAGGDLPAGKVPVSMDNFYMTCPISRASETMAECTAAALDRMQKMAAE